MSVKQGICVIVLGNILKLHILMNNTIAMLFISIQNALLLTLKQCYAYRCIKMFCNSYICHKSDIKLTYIIKRGMLDVMQSGLLHCKLSQFYDVLKHTARGLLYYLIKRLLMEWRIYFFMKKKRLANVYLLVTLDHQRIFLRDFLIRYKSFLYIIINA